MLQMFCLGLAPIKSEIGILLGFRGDLILYYKLRIQWASSTSGCHWPPVTLNTWPEAEFLSLLTRDNDNPTHEIPVWYGVDGSVDA